MWTDEGIAAAASAALRGRRVVPSGRITVSVADAWVTLDGEVEWLYQRAAAIEAVHALPGVAGCTCHVSVCPARER